ncbi:hypothetical protein T03_72 [Trichinella britovi]|uniref:Uncharacterized protein n=1 Tax=Trichinella britovi TaxID=45882 RepID=A0A0V1D5W9_TRIBR|nr:hypothetical protein T03_72 [Trichinella britovi]
MTLFCQKTITRKIKLLTNESMITLRRILSIQCFKWEEQTVGGLIQAAKWAFNCFLFALSFLGDCQSLLLRVALLNGSGECSFSDWSNFIGQVNLRRINFSFKVQQNKRRNEIEAFGKFGDEDEKGKKKEKNKSNHIHPMDE